MAFNFLWWYWLQIRHLTTHHVNKVFPICPCIIAIWWSIAIYVTTRVDIGFENDGFVNWIFWVKYYLSSRTIIISWPKFMVYCVSKTYWLISYKICSINWMVDRKNTEGCFNIGTNNSTNDGTKVIGCNPSQLMLKYVGEFFNSIISSSCIAWIISVNVWRNFSLSSQSTNVHAFNGSWSLNIYFSGIKWFQITTTITILIETLLRCDDFWIIFHGALL